MHEIESRSLTVTAGDADRGDMNTKPAGVGTPTVVMRPGQGHEVHQGRQVLYIEDNESNLALVEWILKREADVELVSAMCGRLGLELAHEHQPDLIVLDLDLPDMPGEQVLKYLQASEDTRRIPVVILSAASGEKRIERLSRLGARDYLSKPFDIPRFLDVIATNLQTRI